MIIPQRRDNGLGAMEKMLVSGFSTVNNLTVFTHKVFVP